jgi:hypothetical protein
MLHNGSPMLAALLAVGVAFQPSLALAQEGSPQPPPPQQETTAGFILGKVYEVDKEKYRNYVAAQRRAQPNFDERTAKLDAEQFLDERARAMVTARRLSTNEQFTSDFTTDDGDYIIRQSPVGAYQFDLLYQDVQYPVQQRLDLNVELSYVAELCFVIDKEEKVAWMVTDGLRRTGDVPPWVPRDCYSQISACLAMLTGPTGDFPDGLLLLLAGGGAAAVTIGIIAADQDEASPPARRPPQ